MSPTAIYEKKSIQIRHVFQFLFIDTSPPQLPDSK